MFFGTKYPVAEYRDHLIYAIAEGEAAIQHGNTRLFEGEIVPVQIYEIHAGLTRSGAGTHPASV
jgi:hypothetical protein